MLYHTIYALDGGKEALLEFTKWTYYLKFKYLWPLAEHSMNQLRNDKHPGLPLPMNESQDAFCPPSICDQNKEALG